MDKNISLCLPDDAVHTVCVYESGPAFQSTSAAFLEWLAMCSGSAGLFSLTPKQEMGIRG